VEGGHEMIDHSGSCLSYPNEKEYAHARTPTIPHRAHLEAILRFAASKRGQPPLGLSPPPHPRPSSLRQTRSSASLRLRLPRRIAEESCSATTLRARRDEWIEVGLMEALIRQIALEAYDSFIGLELEDVAVDGCITKAPCGGEKAGKSRGR